MHRNLKGVMILGVFLILAGLILTFSSISFGMSAADSWLTSQGGSADTSDYQLVLTNNIQNFSHTGTVLLIAGLITSIMGYFKWMQLPHNNTNKNDKVKTDSDAN